MCEVSQQWAQCDVDKNKYNVKEIYTWVLTMPKSVKYLQCVWSRAQFDNNFITHPNSLHV